jgi:hypothetical protein
LFAVQNAVRGNSIHSDVGKGLETTSGGNTELPPPTIATVTPVSGTACANCTVDVYSDNLDEGRVYHGMTTANSSGNWSFSTPVSGPYVTATATDASNNTSEFSSPLLIDSDGDGLADAWEAQGLDANDDGTIDLNLPAMGATSSRKDIFLELDYMSCTVAGSDCAAGDAHNHMPIADGTAAVIQAFNVAPVDGSFGVNLHIFVDEPIRHENAVTANYAVNTLKPLYFGTPSERTNANWSNIREARRMVFHWGLFAHEEPGGLLSGEGEMPGNDLIVYAANQRWQTLAAAMPGGIAAIQAGVVMHELGHNLNLNHGGNGALNCLPNYLSVMSYANQFRALNGDRTLDYSRAALPPLDENHLDENAGIGGPAGQLTVYGPPPIKAASANGPINWDRDDPPVLESDVSVNINNLGYPDCEWPTLDAYTGYNDWANLLYNFRGSAGYLSSSFTGPREVTVLEVEHMLVDSPTVDSNSDGIVNGNDPDDDDDGFSDAIEESAGTNPLAKCGANAWPADINNDGFVDVIGDISVVAGQFGQSVPPAPGRYDIAPDPPDHVIDVIGDISRLAGLFGQSCGS